MANISTRFFGLDLKSPVIAASSSMTGHAEQVIKLAEAGAGAIVLKSIFEEEIYHELQEELSQRSSLHSDPEYLDYFDYVIKEENIKKYLKLISEVKARTNVPIIASVNCVSSGDWVLFARKIEEAGANALELNMYVYPKVYKSGENDEQFYFDTITKVLQIVKIPVSIKISHYFTNLPGIAAKLSQTGIAGITIFNRFYSPDIDIESQTVVVSNILSSPNDYILPLRWTGILSGILSCDLAATTGIHTTETALKFLLAGASAIQVASVLYIEGTSAITRMNNEIADWMDQKGYANLSDFNGSLSQTSSSTQAWDRVQFMKYFGEKAF
ncbi:MAG: dihydroorotate dehydrogenase-like protein [Bacteroidota bacterium]|nr:diguanylate cyclase [Odoribacter sp.]MDP3644556.1 dihydroorotate dehydrogenase-like protein [Bacteroidota bacterium]